MRKLFICILTAVAAIFGTGSASAEGITVSITTDEGFNNPGIIATMERNLGALLTEINVAQQENRLLQVSNMKMSQQAQKMIHMLWATTHFYCDDPEVVDRCWPLKDGYMLRQIPLILTVDDGGFGQGTYQEAVVEFDLQGNIKDFRFAFEAQLGLSMEKCGKVVEESRKLQILSYCDRLRTAYCTKDISFIEQAFSEDALIITGSVVMSKPDDMGYSSRTVKYSKQNKQQYINNLRRAFQRNKYINVQFSEIGSSGLEGGCGTVTRSATNPNMYGVRLKQEWNSSTYSDTGYLFLLWDFTDENHPQIHVRTWQPDMVGDKPLPTSDIFSLSDFDL